MDETNMKPKMSPKDFFVYLGTAVSLYVAAGSLLSLLFDIINARFPDALSGAYGYMGTSETMTFAISTLIIAVPLYLFLSWFIRKDITRDPGKYQLSIRKWFVWFTLFIAGAAVAGDLIALVNTFLGGEITTRFILKVLSVFAVAGAIFAYYFYDMRRANAGVLGVNRVLLLPIIGAIAVIVLGFIVVGSPKTQRAIRLDQQRENALSELQSQVLSYWQTKQTLPVTPDDLEDSFNWYQVPADPDTGAAYEYSVTGPLSFQICATFDRSNKADQTSATMPTKLGWEMDGRFAHDAGRTCFDRTIDPVKYPPTPAAR